MLDFFRHVLERSPSYGNVLSWIRSARTLPISWRRSFASNGRKNWPKKN